jgi:peptidyl-tRNA hydrolase, PTH1 family
MKLLIGLRNPGKTYADTRHNAGEWFILALAKQKQIVFKTEKNLQAELGQMTDEDNPCKILLPLTYMNHSGEPTRAVCQFYRINPEEVLVIHDDLDLPVGTIRLKTGGGHGGHNGLRDIINHLQSNAFHRLRIGIGHPGHKDLVIHHALGKPPLEDREQIQKAIARGIEVLPLILSGKLQEAMNQLHQNRGEHHGI